MIRDRHRYDLILVDGFDHNARAGVLDTQAFYVNCRARLTAQGVFAANLFGRSRGFKASVARIDESFDGRSFVFPPSTAATPSRWRWTANRWLSGSGTEEPGGGAQGRNGAGSGADDHPPAARKIPARRDAQTLNPAAGWNNSMTAKRPAFLPCLSAGVVYHRLKPHRQAPEIDERSPPAHLTKRAKSNKLHQENAHALP